MIGERGSGVTRAISLATLGAVSLLWLGPYVWMALTSLRTLPEIVRAPAYPIPSSFQLDAYREVFRSMPIGRYFLNTIAMAVTIALLQMGLALPAGYALAKLHFTGPPWVMTRTTSNAWKLKMRLVVATKAALGRRSGHVTCTKRRTGPAPSRAAASARAGGMSCRPARKITIA